MNYEDWELVDLPTVHEAYVPKEDCLTLVDYDTHAHYVFNRLRDMDKANQLSNEKYVMIIECIDLFRWWILQGGYVLSNINRLNDWFCAITGVPDVLGKRAVYKGGAYNEGE